MRESEKSNIQFEKIAKSYDPSGRNRTGDISVTILSITAERDNQLHHQGGRAFANTRKEVGFLPRDSCCDVDGFYNGLYSIVSKMCAEMFVLCPIRNSEMSEMARAYIISFIFFFIVPCN